MADNIDIPKVIDNPIRYRGYKYKLKFGGKYVAGFSRTSNFTHVAEMDVKHRGSFDTPAVGQDSYAPITLLRGETTLNDFAELCGSDWDYHNSENDTPESAARNKRIADEDSRKDMVLELYNEGEEKVLAYNIHQCWPSNYDLLAIDSNDPSALIIRRLVLENEGWERDMSVKGADAP